MLRGKARKGVQLIAGAVLLLGLAGAGEGRAADKGMKSGEVSIIRLSARQAGLRDFELHSRTGPSGRLIVEGFTATLGTGRITGKGQVDFANPAGPHRMRVELNGVEGTAFLHLLEVELDGIVEARVDGLFDLTWTGITGAQARRTLNGTARWKASSGFVADADVLRKTSELTGIASLRRFEFQTVGASGTFRSGLLDVTRLKVEGPGQEVTGTGWLNAASREVNMTLGFRVAPELLEQSTRPEIRALGTLAKGARNAAARGGESVDRLVAFPMPLTMTGKVQDPQFHFGPFGTLDKSSGERPDSALPANKRK